MRWLPTAFEERQSKESKMKKFFAFIGVIGILVLGMGFGARVEADGSVTVYNAFGSILGSCPTIGEGIDSVLLMAQ